MTTVSTSLNQTALKYTEKATFGPVDTPYISSPSPHLVSVVLMWFVEIAILLMNVSAIYTVLASSQLRRNVTNVILGNLFIIDTLAAFLLLPFAILSSLSWDWASSRAYCTANGFLNSLLIFGSTLSLALISCERYFSIAHPMSHAATMTMPKTFSVVAILWLISAGCALPPVLGWCGYEYRPHRGYCSFSWDVASSSASYIIVVSIVCFVAPSIVIISMYLAIFHVAKNTASQIKPREIPPPQVSIISVPEVPPRRAASLQTLVSAESSGHAQNKDRKHAENVHCISVVITRILDWRKSSSVHTGSSSTPWKAAKTLTAVTCFFLLFWSPFFIVHLLGVLGDGRLNNQPLAEILSTWLAYSGFAMNAVLYGFLNRQIREEAMKNTKQCSRRCRRVEDDVEDLMPGDDEDFFQFLERTSIIVTQPHCDPVSVSRRRLQSVIDTNDSIFDHSDIKQQNDTVSHPHPLTPQSTFIATTGLTQTTHDYSPAVPVRDNETPLKLVSMTKSNVKGSTDVLMLLPGQNSEERL